VTRVFLSYRHVEPDEGLAMRLVEDLEKRGLSVFADKHIKVGTDWVREIEDQLKCSRAFVVLLSEQSVLSDMVRREVELAYQLLNAGRMRIFPVRIAFEGELPYDLAAYLRQRVSHADAI
jgi:hypothetical protein